MKKITLLLVSLLMIGTILAQNKLDNINITKPSDVNKKSINFLDLYNFDELIVGGYVADQLGGSWTTWNGTPGGDDDALVSDINSYSPNNSFLASDGVDLIFELGEEPINEGAWLYSHYIYVPTGFSGYFNVQSNPFPGEEWVIEVFFNDDGTGYFENASSETFNYEMDTWILVEINFDLDTDFGQVFFDGEMITQFENTFTIGGINYWASDSGGTPGAYFDNVSFTEGTPITNTNCYNFDDLDPGEFLALQLGGMWTTWSGTPGGSDDGFVSDDQSNSPNNSFVVFENTIDLIYKLDEEPIETGAWLYSHYIYVPEGSTGYFNVQSSPTPGEEWVIELFLNGDGTGYFEGGSVETFDYTTDTWILVEINFDLDTDLGQVYFNGNMITEFTNEWTIGAINYYGNDDNGAPEAYYDDVCFTEGTPIYVGIDDSNFDNNTRIYPNPANNIVHINSSVDVQKIKVFNISGQSVLSQSNSDKHVNLNISELKSGVYFVKIFTINNVITRKLVIQ